jgi:D-alanyl-D-alanine carboxypeptidase
VEHEPAARAGYRGATGVKTGYTVAAGRCLVASARRGRVRLGVVLLHSRDPGRQARQLLDRGFRMVR